MKLLLGLLCAGIAITLLSAGCATCIPVEQEPAIIQNFKDPYMFWICSYFREANGRWPTNTTDLVSFLDKDYSNMVQEIRENYKNTQYSELPGGDLLLETHSSAEEKRIPFSFVGSNGKK